MKPFILQNTFILCYCCRSFCCRVFSQFGFSAVYSWLVTEVLTKCKNQGKHIYVLKKITCRDSAEPLRLFLQRSVSATLFIYKGKIANETLVCLTWPIIGRFLTVWFRFYNRSSGEMSLWKKVNLYFFEMCLQKQRKYTS